MTLTSTFSAALEADFIAARGGDQHAFARLVLATQRMVASVALAVTRDIELSEDIAQETYLKAWHKLAGMPRPESFLPWLRQVTRNHAIDHVRRRRHQELTLGDRDRQVLTAQHQGAGPDTTLQNEEQLRTLARALDTIPDESREVLLLFYREGQSSRQVADLLGLSDGAVRKRLQRARDALQSELLANVGDLASRSAPGAAFAAMVAASISAGPAQAAAATAATSTTAKLVMGAIGSIMAALTVMLAAVFWDVRYHVKRARNPSERRELLRHGIVYAVLMASFVGVLAWSKHDQWASSTLLAVSAGYSLAIILLGIARHRIQRRRHRV